MSDRDDYFAADWINDDKMAHGGIYCVRRVGDGEVVCTTNPYKDGWEKAVAMAEAMNGRVEPLPTEPLGKGSEANVGDPPLRGVGSNPGPSAGDQVQGRRSVINTFLGLSADEWAQSEDGLPVCPWDGKKLTPRQIAGGVVAMLRLQDESTGRTSEPTEGNGP